LEPQAVRPSLVLFGMQAGLAMSVLLTAVAISTAAWELSPSSEGAVPLSHPTTIAIATSTKRLVIEPG
jgi:hypothetical protein